MICIICFTLLLFLSKFQLHFNIPHGEIITDEQTSLDVLSPQRRKQKNVTISILSWNIAECRPSDSAPEKWHSSDCQEESQCNYQARTFCDTISSNTVRDLILTYSPDVIALQESPNSSWGGKYYDYILMGSVRSHCGFVQLLLRQDLAALGVRLRIDNLPTVAATVEFASGRKITFASNHLAPYGYNNEKRLKQVEQVVKSMPTNDYVIVGDMNMRMSEDHAVETLGLIDAWKDFGSKNNSMHTWDSFANRYYSHGRAYQARYDRIYVSTSGKKIVQDFGLVGHDPVSGLKHHFLSDHFGLFAKIVFL